MNEHVEDEELREIPPDERPAGIAEDVDQDSIGPIEGDEAIDDDTDYQHTPVTPPIR